MKLPKPKSEVLEDSIINIEEETKKKFLKGADIAYEQIVTSFANGDKKTLKSLLGKNLYADFSEEAVIKFWSNKVYKFGLEQKQTLKN